MERYNVITLGTALEDITARYPDKISIIYEDAKLTYGQVDKYANRLANALLGLGFNKGNRVCLFLKKTPELVISFLAVAKIGGIVAPVNYILDIKHQRLSLNNIKPSFIIADPDYLPLINRLNHKNIFVITTGEREESPFLSWEKLLGNSSDLPPRITVYPEDVLYYNFTSGSTGEPKIAIVTHANIFWNTVSAVESLGLKPSDIHLCLFPPYLHPHEIFTRSIYLGGTAVLLERFYPKSVVNAISSNKVTCLMGIPSMIDFLFSVIDFKKFDLSSLRLLESGGMPTDIKLIQKVKREMGIHLIPVWGSAETTGIAFHWPLNEPAKHSLLGIPCAHYQAKIMDRSGAELPSGQAGEITIKGPAVMKGYLNMPEETSGVLKRGWYYTGDLGRMDKYGNFYFIGRKDRVMKVGGMKVSSLEIEKTLQSCPAVRKAVVMSRKDRLRGEVLRVIISLTTQEKNANKRIRRYCQNKLDRYKIPRIIEFDDALQK